MKLIGRYDSPFVRRVGVSLHVLGFSFEHLQLSPFSQASDLRKISAIGRMPALVLESGETLIDSAAILDYVDERAGSARALLPASGEERRKCLRMLASATAACDKAIAINYERRRPAKKVFTEWIARCQGQLHAALGELEEFVLTIDQSRLMQPEITTACMIGYVRRVDPQILRQGHYPRLEHLSSICEARPAFLACPEQTTPSANLEGLGRKRKRAAAP
jgi:glutathione S-transferase